VGPAGRIYRSIAAAAARRISTAFSSKCEQRHVVSRRRKLNTDLFILLITYLLLLKLKYSKGKVFPYSLLSVGPGADPGVQAVSPQVT